MAGKVREEEEKLHRSRGSRYTSALTFSSFSLASPHTEMKNIDTCEEFRGWGRHEGAKE